MNSKLANNILMHGGIYTYTKIKTCKKCSGKLVPKQQRAIDLDFLVCSVCVAAYCPWRYEFNFIWPK